MSIKVKESELKILFNELLIFMEKHGGNNRNINTQRKKIHIILNILYCNDIDYNEKFLRVEKEYKRLLIPRDGLSEFYIPSNDFEERIKFNKALDEIKNRLWQIFR